MNCCDILVEIGKENSFNKDELYLSDECNNHNSEYVDNNTLFNRFENEVSTMNCGILRENWFDVSNPQVIDGKSVFGIKHKTLLDEEFLLLEADDDIHDDSDFVRVFISSSNTSSVTVSNSFTLVSHELPASIGNNGMDVIIMHQQHNDSATASIAPSSRTPSRAASSMEKSKVKTESLRYPFSHSGNSHDVIALRELNGVSPESTAISTPSRNTSDSTQSRSNFLKNLSRQSSSKDTGRLTRKSRDAPLVDTSDANSLTEHKSNITDQNGNVLGELSKLSSNIVQKHSTKTIIHSEEEEIAFLRSLGWEKNSEDADEGLTLKEILDFYDKHAQNYSYDQIFSKLCIKT